MQNDLRPQLDSPLVRLIALAIVGGVAKHLFGAHYPLRPKVEVTNNTYETTPQVVEAETVSPTV